MKLLSYSKALYSTWHYVEPLKLLLDAGEGLNTFLEGRLLAFRTIAITHAHTDHFTGLQNILVTRLREMEVTKEPILPIQLIYPEDSYTLTRYFQYLKEVTSRWEDLVTLCPVNPGDCVPLEGIRGYYLHVLKAEHFVHKQSALAFRIEKEQFSLQPEFQQLSQKEINQLISQNGRTFVTECKRIPMIFYSGDGRPLYDPQSENVALLIQESTFLEGGPKHTHAQLGETVQLFRKLKAKHMVLFHLSTRYLFKEYMQELEKWVPDEEERSRIFLIKPGNFFQKDITVPGL